MQSLNVFALEAENIIKNELMDKIKNKVPQLITFDAYWKKDEDSMMKRDQVIKECINSVKQTMKEMGCENIIPCSINVFADDICTRSDLYGIYGYLKAV